MKKLWCRGSWGRYLALFLAVVLALNTVSPAVKAAELEEPVEQTLETQPEREPIEVTEPEETEPAEAEDPAEEPTETEPEEPAEDPGEVTEPAEEPSEAEVPGEETEPAEEPAEAEPEEPAESVEVTEPEEPAEDPAEEEPAEEPTEETEPVEEPVAEPTETEPEEPAESVEVTEPAEPAEEPTEEEPIEDPTDADDYPELTIGVEARATINTAGVFAYFKFIPTKTGAYAFFSRAVEDTYGAIFDSDMRCIAEDNDSGDVDNFQIICTLQNNTTYYFGAKYFNDEQTGNFPVVVETLPEIESLEAADTYILELHHGDYMETEDGDTWFYYNSIKPASITVTTKGGIRHTGSIDDILDRLYEESSSWLEYSYGFVDSQSYEHQFSAGNTYEAVLSFGGKTVSYNVTIESTPIVSVEATDTSVMELDYGNYQETADGDRWFYYNAVLPAEISVITIDGECYSGPVESVRNWLYEAYSVWIDYNYSFVDSQSYEHQFTAGNTYEAKLTFGGKETSYNVTIEATPIVSVDATDTTVMEFNNGNFQETENGESWFYYYGILPAEISVTTVDGDRYTGPVESVRDWLYDAYKVWFYYSYNYVDSQSYEHQFTAGNTYEAVLNFGGKTASYNVRIEKNPITSVEASNAVLIELNNGYYEKTSGNEWFYYYNIEPASISVTTADGERYSGSVENVRSRLNSVYGKWFDYNYYFVDSQSYEHPFTAGNTYGAMLSFGGKTASYNVTIEASPIISVEAANATIMEFNNGYYRETSGNEWFYYYNINPSSITVTMADGEHYSGSIDEVYSQLYEIYGTWFSFNYYFVDNQSYAHPFTARNTYEAVLSFGGKTAIYYVTIEENPIVSLEAVNATIMEFNDGYYKNTSGNEWFYYYSVEPASVTVTTADGERYSGSISDVSNQLYNVYGEWFDYSYDYVDSQNYLNQFIVGNTYEAEVSFGGKETTYYVTIKANPIVSVETSDATIMEFNSGHYVKTEDGEEWFYYYCCEPDGITVTLADGNTYSGTVWEVENQLENEYGLEIGHGVNYVESQSSLNQFTAGNAYEAKLTFGGKTATYYVKIEANPIVSVEASNVTITEFNSGYYEITEDGKEWFYYYCIEPDSITVTMADGNTYSGNVWEVENQLENEYGLEIGHGVNYVESQSSLNQFTAGNAYEVKLNFGGKTAIYYVTIEENPIVSMEASDATIMEFDNGYYRETEDGEEWFYYYCIKPAAITVKTSDGETYYGDPDEVHSQLYDEYGVWFDWHYDFVDEQSFENQFTVWNSYDAVQYFGGKYAVYQVTIVTESINIISTSPEYQIAKAGDTVSLTVEAESDHGDIHYSWSMENDSFAERVDLPDTDGTASITVDTENSHEIYTVYCLVSDDYNETEITFRIDVYSDLTELVVNEEAQASGSQNTYFYFVPEQTRVYTFSSYASGDPVCYLYEVINGNRNYIESADDNGEGMNFIISRKLVKGHYYLFEVRPLGTCDDFPVILTQAEHYLLLDRENTEQYFDLEEGETAALQPIVETNSENVYYEWEYANNSGSHQSVIEGEADAVYETDRPGIYYVSIGDDYGNWEQTEFYVRLAYMPLQAYYDEETGNDFYLEPGETALLKIRIAESAGQEIHYRWYRNEKLIEGEIGSSITANLGGTYYCDVYDDYGNEATVWFYVRYNITFEVWPKYYQQYYYVPYGGQADLQVEYNTSGQNLYFSWYHEDELVAENTDVYRANANGNYYCWVSDDYGNREEVYFDVYIVSADNWGVSTYTTPNQNGLVSSGDDVTFEVRPYDVADPESFTYAWYQVPDESAFGDQNKWTRIAGESGTTLTLHNITAKNYVACLVTDPFGASSRIAEFTAGVQNFLNIRAANDQTMFALPEGESVTFEVLVYADDYEGLRYEWLEYRGHDEAWYPLENSTSTLTVTKVGTAMQNWECRVSDRYGNEAEIFFYACSDNHLTAEAVDPYRYVTRGSSDTLEVTVDADDLEGLTFTWYNEYGYTPTGDSGPTREVTVYSNSIYPCRVTDRYGMEVWVYFERVTDRTWYLEGSMLPEDGKVNYGDYVSISSDLYVSWFGTSDPGVEFRWLTTDEDPDGDSWTVLEGQTGPSLSAAVTEHRYYKLEAKDKFGLSDEQIFEVFVENHLEVEYDPEPEMTSAGGSVTLEAEVSADDLEGAQYIWYTLDDDQSSQQNIARAGKTILSTDGPTYKVDNVTYFGTVYLDVIDKYGNTETAKLSYGVENHFTAEAEEETVKIGPNEDAELKVVYSADNMDGMTFEWFTKDGWALEGDGAVLTAENVDVSVGLYCLVTDCYGTTIRVDFFIEIQYGWDAKAEYDEVVPIGQNAVISIQVTGDYDISEFSFIWYESYDGTYWSRIWGENESILTYTIWNDVRYFRCEITRGSYTKNLEFMITGDNAFEVSLVQGSLENIVPYGSDVTIEFKATGNDLGNLWYGWERYIDFGDTGEWQNIGNKSLSYTIRNVTKLVTYRFYAGDGYGNYYETEFTVDAISAVTYTLDQEAVEIPIDGSVQLKLVGSDGSTGTGTWTSSDTKIAAVDANGLVKAVKYGKAVIHVKMDNGYEADCAVQTRFKDATDSSKYYYKAIYWAADYKPAITQGYSTGENAGKFGVGLNCVRKDFVLFLYRMAGTPKVTDAELAQIEKEFSDVSGLSKSFRSAIAWAYKKGITKGYTSGEYKGKFGIEKEITRREALIMIWRYVGKTPPTSTGIAAARKFKDVNGVYKESSDSFKAIAWAAEKGVTKGYTKASSLPADHKDAPIPCFGCDFNCLREDMILFLYRTYNLK